MGQGRSRGPGAGTGKRSVVWPGQRGRAEGDGGGAGLGAMWLEGAETCRKLWLRGVSFEMEVGLSGGGVVGFIWERRVLAVSGSQMRNRLIQTGGWEGQEVAVAGACRAVGTVKAKEEWD